MKTTIKAKFLKELDTVINFIKQWQSKNDYNPTTLDSYNKKFELEFHSFLDRSKFLKETTELFK